MITQISLYKKGRMENDLVNKYRFYFRRSFRKHSFYYYYYYYSLEFFTSAYADGFHWRLSDSKFPQVSRTLLSILAVFSNAVVWMVSTWLPTSKSSRPFNNPLVTMPKAPITIGIIVTFMFHSFFNSLARSRYLSLFSDSFSFILFLFLVDYYKVWSSGWD